MKSLSIITVTYNAENVIGKTIQSVRQQNFSHYEHIIIDGCSKDSTLQIVQEMSHEKMLVFSEPDEGIYDAMNKGMKKAKGDYVIFLNAGDVFASTKVLHDVMSQIDGEGVYYGNSIREYEKKNVIYNEKTNRFMLTRHNICHQTIFYPLQYIKELGFNKRYKIFADWAANIILYKRLKFIHLNVLICKYDMNGISSSEDRIKDPAFIADLPYLAKEYLGILPYLFVRIRFVLRNILCQI